MLEQDEGVATLICQLLTAADYQVVWLIESSTAIKQIQLLKPTVVILDLDLPDAIDVEEIPLQLKQLRGTKDIKAIVLSSDEKIVDQYGGYPGWSRRLLTQTIAANAIIRKT